ncbi:hypothetical protein SATMO3_39790 [Sporomusa aerivorans]
MIEIFEFLDDIPLDWMMMFWLAIFIINVVILRFNNRYVGL